MTKLKSFLTSFLSLSLRGLRVDFLKAQLTLTPAESFPYHGALEMRDSTTALFTERGNSNDAFAGAIGTGIFKQFNVIFDYNQQQIIFERR